MPHKSPGVSGTVFIGSCMDYTVFKGRIGHSNSITLSMVKHAKPVMVQNVLVPVGGCLSFRLLEASVTPDLKSQ